MSPQQAIEMILTCQLASYLALPIFVVDPEGMLVFYNESAEPILGKRFDETGAMPMSEWSTIFQPTDEAGVALAPTALPLALALAEQRPVHRAFWIHGLDNVRRHIEATCLPLIGQTRGFLGAVALFWEVVGR
jgi:PAS domain-containing protein